MTQFFKSAVKPDFLLLASMGKIPDCSIVHIAAHKHDLDADTEETLWHHSTDFVSLASAERLDVVSTSANDTSAGTGLRSVLIVGLDENHLEIQEIIILNGTSPVKTTNSFIFVNHIYGWTSGSTKVNEGMITATAETSSTVQDIIGINHGYSHAGKYMIPANKMCYPVSIYLDVVKTTGSNDILADFIIRTRQQGLHVDAPWYESFNVQLDTRNTSFEQIKIPITKTYTEKTEVVCSGISDATNTNLSMAIMLLQTDI